MSWPEKGDVKSRPQGGQRAGDRTRTGECQLGRLMPYHLATPAFGCILSRGPSMVKPFPVEHAQMGVITQASA